MRFERYIKGKKDYYLRSILFSYEGLPILFVSQDKEGELYLCECTESRFGKFEWTFSKTDCNILEQLLSKKITIYEAMKAKSSLKQLITYDIAEDLTYQEEKPFFDIEPERLPEKDAYLEISDNGAEQDIRTLKAERDHRVTFDTAQNKCLPESLASVWDVQKQQISYTSKYGQDGQNLSNYSDLEDDYDKGAA